MEDKNVMTTASRRAELGSLKTRHALTVTEAGYEEIARGSISKQ
jgi:hypothetical protein